MRTSYDKEEENEPEPVNLNDDDCPIEFLTLNTNASGVLLKTWGVRAQAK